MMKRKTYLRHRPDLVSEELVATLLEKNSYEFSDLFQAIYVKLRARNATSGGEEMLRLRVYEKLQTLVSQGLVKKDGKVYSAVKAALRVRSTEMGAAKAAAELRRSSVLHSE
jgi:hypothetical protein